VVREKSLVALSGWETRMTAFRTFRSFRRLSMAVTIAALAAGVRRRWR